MSPDDAKARVPLTRERVLRAGLALADEHGLEGLSMRKLAQALGVEAMSLYNHVANKDDLVDGMIELVAAEMDSPPEGVHWKDAMRQSALSGHHILMRHPWAAALWMSPREVTPLRLQQGDAELRCLRDAGFSPDLTYHAFHVLQSHILGFTLYLLSFRFDVADLPTIAAKFLRDFPADEYPYLAEHIQQHMEPSEERSGTFEFGLDLVLDSLERLRDEQPT